jgi:hypothetical protein
MCLYGIFRTNFRVYSFKKRKKPNPKKVYAIVTLPVPTNP